MNLSKARANEVDSRTPTTNIVLSKSPATLTQKARRGTKIYEQWQGPNQRARINNSVKWDLRWWHKYMKQVRVLRYKYRNRRLRLTPRSPCAGVATGLLQTPRTQFKNKQKWQSIDTCFKLNAFKITTFPRLEQRRNMTDYSF